MASQRTAPPKAQWVQILLAVADADLHGNGIRRRVLDQTNGEMTLWPVMLYGSLDQMVQAGLIKPLEGDGVRPEGVSRQHRYYRITRKGRHTLGEEARRFHGWAALAQERLALAERRSP